jgi:hypothetical protein
MYIIAGYKLKNLQKIELLDIEGKKVIIILGTKVSQIYVDGDITYLLRLNHTVSDKLFLTTVDNLKNIRKLSLFFISKAKIEQNFEGGGIPKRLLILDLDIK